MPGVKFRTNKLITTVLGIRASLSGQVQTVKTIAKPQVLVLTGPTAVGKTQPSLRLAKTLQGEIISADSVQVYRGLDIGSDKLPLADRQGVEHHLLDILPADAEFSAGDFFDLARQQICEILKRGKVPIVVGGTGLYLRWLVHGKPKTPRSTPQMAAAAQKKLDKAWARLEALKGAPLDNAEKWKIGVEAVRAAGDPISADRLDGEPNNFYRLLRVYEIVLETGRPLAELDIAVNAELDYDFRCFFLNRPRMELYRRIDARCEQMIHNGILQEAAWLLDQGIRPDSNCASRAIGYRQAMQFVAACQADSAPLSKDSLVQLVRDMQQGSRQLCHRQLTWFRDDSMYHWLDATQPAECLLNLIQQELQKPHHEGACGDSGRLSKEQEKAMRAYQPIVQLQSDDAAVAKLIDNLKTLVNSNQAVPHEMAQ